MTPSLTRAALDSSRLLFNAFRSSSLCCSSLATLGLGRARRGCARPAKGPATAPALPAAAPYLPPQRPPSPASCQPLPKKTKENKLPLRVHIEQERDEAEGRVGPHLTAYRSSRHRRCGSRQHTSGRCATHARRQRPSTHLLAAARHPPQPRLVELRPPRTPPSLPRPRRAPSLRRAAAAADGHLRLAAGRRALRHLLAHQLPLPRLRERQRLLVYPELRRLGELVRAPLLPTATPQPPSPPPTAHRPRLRAGSRATWRACCWRRTS